MTILGATHVPLFSLYNGSVPVLTKEEGGEGEGTREQRLGRAGFFPWDQFELEFYLSQGRREERNAE